MSERDDGYGRRGLPKDTAEFRATPDTSASTAQFQAFARAYDNQPSERWADEAWPKQPDTGQAQAPRRRVGLIVAGVVVAALIVLGVVAFLMHG